MNHNHPYRLILFCHERSGSTTLMDALNLHPHLSILEEPFHEKFHLWNPEKRNYHALIEDRDSLDEQLEHIYRDYDGIKILAYQMSEKIYDYLLKKKGYKVIFLRRRNHLQTVVSTLIAKQTNLWEKSRLEGPIEALYANLQPLSMENIDAYLRGMKWIQEHYEAVIGSREAGSFMMWTYEDLYLAPEAQRLANLSSIYDFLGVEPFFDDNIRKKLDPSRSKINSKSTYRFIPNAAAIDERFGCDETGWLNTPAGPM